METQVKHFAYITLFGYTQQKYKNLFHHFEDTALGQS